jgi:hypothetical protein
MVDSCPDGIDSMYLPCEAIDKCSLTRQGLERGHGIGFLAPISIVEDNLKEYAIHLVGEGLANSLKCIGTQPVVAIHKADKLARSVRQCHIAGKGYPMVLIEGKHLHTSVSLGILS